MKKCGHNRAWYPIITLDGEQSNSSSSCSSILTENHSSACADNALGHASTLQGTCEKRKSRSKSCTRSHSRSRNHHVMNKNHGNDRIYDRRHSRSRSRGRSRSRSRGRSRSRSRGRRMEKSRHHGHDKQRKECHLSLFDHHRMMKNGKKHHYHHHGKHSHDDHHGNHHGSHFHHVMKKIGGYHHHCHRSKPMPRTFSNRSNNNDHSRIFRGRLGHAVHSRENILRTILGMLERA